MMKRKDLFTLLLLTVFLFAQTATTQFMPIAYGDGEDWLTGWDYRKSHIVEQSTGAGTNYQVKITVVNGSGSDSGDTVYIDDLMRSDFGDVNFTDNDGITGLHFWMETGSLNEGENATFWIAVSDDLTSTDANIYMYYGNSDVTTSSNGTNTFTFFDDFETAWERQGIVLATGGGVTSWDECTVIQEGNPQILTEESTVFKMWVRGTSAGPAYDVYYFESQDGFSWTGHGDNPVVDTAEGVEGPFVMKNEGTYYMYVHGGPVDWEEVDLWNSSDGVVWVKDTDTVLDLGAPDEWDDDNIGNIFVWIEDSTWYMIYDAKAGAPDNDWKTGLANSTDGRAWVKSELNPVFERPPDGSTGGPFIKKLNEIYYMWYHGARETLLPTDGMRASSTNLTTWTDYASNPTFPRAEEYEGVGLTQAQVADFSLLDVGNETYVWYTCLKTQSDSRGIALAISSMNYTELVASDENSIDLDKWDGDTEYAIQNNGVLMYGGHTAIVTMKSITDFSDPLIMRTKRNMTQPESNWFIYGMGDDTGAVNVVTTLFNKVTLAVSMRIGDADSFEDIVSNWTSGGYHIVEQWWKSDQVRWFEDNVEMTGSPYSTVENIPTADIPILFMIGPSSGFIYSDWVLIRKYTSPEPSHGAWGSEESDPSSNADPTVTSFIISDLSDGVTLFKILWYRPIMVVDDSDGLSDIGTSYFAFETDYGWHNVSYNYQTDVYAVETETGMIMVANGYTEFSGTSLTIHFYLYLLESIDVNDNVDVYCRVTDASSGDSDWSLEQLDYFNILDYVEDVGGSSSWTPTETPSEEPQEEWRDTDDDGIPDWDDPDIDGDGLPNEYDEDIDGDDIPNQLDPEPFIPEEKEERPILFSFKTPSGKIINIINPMYYLKPYQEIIIPFLFLLLAIILYSIYRSRQKKSLDERVSNKITNLGGKMVKR